MTESGLPFCVLVNAETLNSWHMAPSILYLLPSRVIACNQSQSNLKQMQNKSLS